MKLAVEASNLAIVAGYLAMGWLFATWVLPIERWWITTIAACLFFVTCGATHMHQFAHEAANKPITVDDMGSWHMVAIHAPQAVSVVVAVFGMAAARRWITNLLDRIKELEAASRAADREAT